jgi:hypothetical protein
VNTTLGVEGIESSPPGGTPTGTCQDELYREAAAVFGAALERLARAYESDPEKGRDLQIRQIQLELEELDALERWRQP